MPGPAPHKYFPRSAYRILEAQCLREVITIVGRLSGWIDPAPDLPTILCESPARRAVPKILSNDPGWKICAPIVDSFPIRRSLIKMLDTRSCCACAYQQAHAVCGR